MSRQNKAKTAETIKVLFVNIEGEIAGAEQSLLLLASYLRNDFKLAVACPTPSSLAQKLSQLQIKTFRISSPPQKLNWLPIWVGYFVMTNIKIIAIICSASPILIHANNTKAMLSVMLAAFFTKTKLIWHVRDLTSPALVTKLCSLFCCQIIAVSNSVKNLLVRQGVKSASIVVNYNGSQLGYQPSKNNENRSNELLTFVNIGQFVPWKRQDIFIEASRIFIQKSGEAEFILVGDDIFSRDAHYKKKLLKSVKNISIGERISFLGWYANIEILWSQIDCLVHTADREPFGRVIIEAMAHKVPVIAANCYGPAEIIRDGITGLLVKPNDSEQLALAMRRIALDRQLRRTLADAGFNHVVNNFAAEKTAERAKAIYDAILAN